MKNEEYMKELEKRLTDFRSARQNMKELAVAIIGDVLYKEDLFFTSAIDRSMGLLDGMIEMLKQRNLTCAGILVRTQVDNCMRVFAAFIAEDRTEFIDAFLKGEKIRNIKDNQGRKMKDVVLKERLAEYDKYLKNVYDNSSGYIHLSSKAFHASATASEADNYHVEFSIGLPLNEKANVILLEAADAFLHYLQLQNSLLIKVADSKRAT